MEMDYKCWAYELYATEFIEAESRGESRFSSAVFNVSEINSDLKAKFVVNSPENQNFGQRLVPNEERKLEAFPWTLG